ncbi:MAG: nucleotidyltransferase family protein [Bacteroidales bacterium]|nr:nucleotidyltransferase family protein [Bacteroidales bacterium]
MSLFADTDNGGSGMQAEAHQEIAGLVLAAGLSTRMGVFKPLVPLCGKSLIQNTVDSVLSGGADHVVVVVGFRAEEMEYLISHAYGPEVQTVYNPDFAVKDMMHSILVGCEALPRCEAFFLLPGDMPVVSRSTFLALTDQWREKPDGIIFPSLDGYRKHPPLIGSSMIPDILSFHGDGGLRELWKQKESLIQTVPVDDEGVWVDVDTPQDYRRCRSRYEQKRCVQQEVGCNYGKDQSVSEEERSFAEGLWTQHLCG